MNKFLKCAIAASAVFALQAQAAVGDAFDTFADLQTATDFTVAGGGVWATESGPHAWIFGGYRDIYAEKTVGVNNFRRVQGQSGGGEFSFSEDTSQVGYSIIRYDGAGTNLAGPGLGNNLGSLLSFGTGFTFTYTSDAAFSIEVIVYKANGDQSYGVLNAVDTNGLYVNGDIQFAGLVPIVGGGADFANVAAIDIIFNQVSGTASVDLSFTPPIGVPEPGSLALAGLALLGLGAARRRKA